MGGKNDKCLEGHVFSCTSKRAVCGFLRRVGMAAVVSMVVAEVVEVVVAAGR